MDEEKGGGQVRVLMTVSEWPTHYMAMVPLGWALQAAGHEVRVACAPSQCEPVSRAGLVPVPVLDGMSVTVRNRLAYLRQAGAGQWPYPWAPPDPLTGARSPLMTAAEIAGRDREVREQFRSRIRDSFTAAIALVRQWRPDLVLHDPVGIEGLLAARVEGVPAVMGLWGPVGSHEPGLARVVPEDDSGSFERHGLPADPLDSVTHVVDPCPESMAPPVEAHRLAVRYVPYNGPGRWQPGQLPRATRPRVVVVWSTALSAMAGPESNLLPQVLRGLGRLPVDTVVTATRPDLAALGSVPSSVRLLERAPLHLLLEEADLLVHHGGAGSTMTALAHGVPQLVLSCAADQAIAGERLVAAGGGRHLAAHTVGADTLAAAVTEILEEPGYQRAARRLAAELAARPSPAQLVPTLEALAQGAHSDPYSRAGGVGSARPAARVAR